MSHNHHYELVSAEYEPEPIPSHVLSEDDLEPRFRGVVTERCECGAIRQTVARDVVPGAEVVPSRTLPVGRVRSDR